MGGLGSSGLQRGDLALLPEHGLLHAADRSAGLFQPRLGRHGTLKILY
jgi:hypothetical protein